MNVKSFHVVVDVAEVRSYSEKELDGSRKLIRPASRKAVVIEVDLDALTRDLGVRAATNKSGKAVEASGAVRALLAK